MTFGNYGEIIVHTLLRYIMRTVQPMFWIQKLQMNVEERFHLMNLIILELVCSIKFHI